MPHGGRPQEPPEDDPPGRDVVIIFAVFFEAGLAPFSLFLGWLVGHPPLADVSSGACKMRFGEPPPPSP